jgi:hypothetical protein
VLATAASGAPLRASALELAGTVLDAVEADGHAAVVEPKRPALRLVTP